MSTSDRDALLQGLGKRWYYGKIIDADGRARWGIDEAVD